MSDTNMIVAGPAGRYATALFGLAQDMGKLDQVAADLAALTRALATSADLTALVKSPWLTRAEQAKAMDAVLTRMGTGDLVKKFVGLVASKRRLYDLGRMIEGFNILLAKARGETTAEVASAQALDESQISALKAALKTALGRDVALTAKVDPSLLGGLVVKVGSRMVDSSLKTKLANLRLAMKEAG